MNTLRFEVVIAGFKTDERTVYTVASLLGAYKAVAMATGAHMAKAKHHRIYRIGVIDIPGNSPLATDLVDRMEW